MYVHTAQDADVEDLVGAAPDIKFARSKAFWRSRLHLMIRWLLVMIEKG